MNLGVDPHDIHFATGVQEDSTLRLELPIDLEAEAATEIKKGDHLIQTPSGLFANTKPTRLGPFCRTADATRLLGKILELVAQPALKIGELELEQCHTFDMSLRDLAMKLMQQATNGWEECCAAIGICFR
jgi:hypothetical protein